MQKNKLYFVAILILSLFCAVGVQGFCFTQEINKVYAEESYWNGSVATSFAGGDGSEEAPYQISNAEELALLRSILSVEDGNPYMDSTFNVAAVRQSHFVLTNDIYLNDEKFEYDADSGLIRVSYGEGYVNSVYIGTGIKGVSLYGASTCFDTTASEPGTFYQSNTEITTTTYSGTINSCDPIGFNINNNAFKGVFDGEGYSIIGLYQNNNSGRYGGLFSGLYSETNEVMVENLNLSDGVVVCQEYAGGIAGYATDATIENCKNANDIVVDGARGAGIIGNAISTRVNTCLNSADILGISYVGGICGMATLKTVVSNSGNAGKILGEERIGGLCGCVGIASKTENCYNNGNVDGLNSVGGISGYLLANPDEEENLASEVLNCYNSGEITGQTNVNSIYGEGTGRINVENCYYSDPSEVGDPSSSVEDLIIEALNTNVYESPLDLEVWKKDISGRPILRLETRWREIVLDQDYEGDTDLTTYIKIGENGYYTSQACDVVDTFEVPTRTGLTFLGYYTKRGNGTQIINGSGELRANAMGITDEKGNWSLLRDRTIYAHWQVATFSITYNNVDGATLNSAPTTHVYDATTILVNPTKVGASFGGWYTSSSFLGEPLETLNANAYSSDITLFAKWTNNVAFYNWDGTLLDTATVTTGSDAVYVGATPTKPQTIQNVFTFAGWGEAADAVVSNVLVNITANKSVYAIYTQNARQYNILVNKNDGSSANATLVACYGEQQTDFSAIDSLAFNPGRVGYSLLGLYTLAEDGVCVIENTDGVLSVKASVSGFSSAYRQWVIEEDQTLFAHWTPKVLSITYKDEDDTSFSGNNLFELTSTHTYASTTTLVAAQKQNYNFLGWHNNAECSGSAISEIGGAYAPAEDFTLFAKWTIKTFAVVFKNFNGTDLESLYIPYGSSAIYPNPEPTRSQTAYERYVFAGWVTSAGGNVFADLTNIVEDTTVFAHYDVLPAEYKINYYKNDGTASFNTKTIEYNKSGIAVLPINREGYNFEGYYTAVENGVRVISEQGEILANVEGYTSPDKKWVITQNTNLYAKYAAKSFEITYKDEQGEDFSGDSLVSLPSTHTYNITTTLVSVTSTHYDFAGWFVSSDCSGMAIESLLAESIESDITLYAKWTPKEYEITFKNHDGSEIKTQNVAFGNLPVFTGEVPTKEQTDQYEYIFSAWQPTIVSATGDEVYVATYSQVLRTYSVSFYNEDGSILYETAEIFYGDLAFFGGSLPTKEVEGKIFNFVGWTIMPNGTTFDDLDNVVSNRSVYASFDEVAPKYLVKFYNDGGGTLLFSAIVVKGSSANYSGATPTKADSLTSSFAFSGWKTAVNGGENADLSEINENTSVYAAFTSIPKTYQIKFYDEATNTHQIVSVQYGGTAIYPSAQPTKSSTARYDYTFAGWATAPNATTSDTLSNVTESKSLYPLFTKTERVYTVTFYNEDGTQVLASKTTTYGGSVEYSGEAPKKEVDGKKYVFEAWKTSTTHEYDATLSIIVADASVFASFINPSLQISYIWYILIVAATVLILVSAVTIKLKTKKSLILIINDQRVAIFKYKHGEKIVLPAHFLRNYWYTNKDCTREFNRKFMGFNTFKIYAKDEIALKERPKIPPKHLPILPRFPPKRKAKK